MLGHYGHSVHYSDGILFTVMGGHALTSLKGGGPYSLGTFDHGVVGHLAFPINATQLLTKPGKWCWGNFYPGCSHPRGIRCKEKITE